MATKKQTKSKQEFKLVDINLNFQVPKDTPVWISPDELETYIMDQFHTAQVISISIRADDLTRNYEF